MVLVTRQEWRDVLFAHWPVDPAAVAKLLPSGVAPDLLDGGTYVGLVALRMCRVTAAALPPLPYLSWFPEINVRLYSIGADGRQGVVFRSLDAARLPVVAAARAAIRLPYEWSRMRVHRDGETVGYESRRRWPDRPGARLRLTARIGEPVGTPSAFEEFVTARWGLHQRWYGGRTVYLPVEHPRWPLRRATLEELDQDLITAAGLPSVSGPPCSVLYSPGVAVRMAYGRG
jgi:uncharacterized protein YqjF (DUF2071 family)